MSSTAESKLRPPNNAPRSTFTGCARLLSFTCADTMSSTLHIQIRSVCAVKGRNLGTSKACTAVTECMFAPCDRLAANESGVCVDSHAPRSHAHSVRLVARRVSFRSTNRGVSAQFMNIKLQRHVLQHAGLESCMKVLFCQVRPAFQVRQSWKLGLLVAAHVQSLATFPGSMHVCTT